MSNPPSRGSGQGSVKTYGKHEVPVLNVEEEKADEEKQKETAEDGGQRALVNKQLVNAGALIHSKSFPNAGSLQGSPVSTPGSQRRQLPPSGIKLPVPPPALLNGIANVHKSASSASLNLHVSPSAAKSDGLREAVTVPNAGQMLAEARAELLDKAGGTQRTLTRLPPLKMPKGPVNDDDQQKGGKKDEEVDKGREESGSRGPIATMASEPMPQMRALRPQKIAPLAPIASRPSRPASVSPESGVPTAETISTATTGSNSIAPPPARVPPLHSVAPNQVPVHNPMRRSSSVGQLPSSKDMALAPHKPLPAISEPAEFKKGGSAMYSGKRGPKRRLSKPWRLALKCLIVALFLTIPVLIFVLIMLFSDGFSSGHAANSSDPLPPSDAGSPAPGPLTTTPGPSTPFNIVGGAIFAPISMQNETSTTASG